jgi:hypothetical protein
MKIADASRSVSSALQSHSAAPDTWPIGRTIATTFQHCSCDGEAISAVRAYLREHFPNYAVRDFHERARVTKTGLPTQYADHHVLSVTDWELAYYAVLTTDFFEHPCNEVRERLRRWDVASMLQAHRIVIASGDGIAPL